MIQHRLIMLVIVAGLAVLGLAGGAEAIIISDFPIFGVVNGVQTARINAVLQDPAGPESSCPVTLVFIDSQGRTYGNPDDFLLRGGAAVHKDFIGDPNTRGLERLAIRVQVTWGDPDAFAGCAGGVLASVEVADRFTRATHVILANPVMRQTQAGR
jgi:hypothetical protein